MRDCKDLGGPNSGQLLEKLASLRSYGPELLIQVFSIPENNLVIET
jgi:hypothetical protein